MVESGTTEQSAATETSATTELQTVPEEPGRAIPAEPTTMLQQSEDAAPEELTVVSASIDVNIPVSAEATAEETTVVKTEQETQDGDDIPEEYRLANL